MWNFRDRNLLELDERSARVSIAVIIYKGTAISNCLYARGDIVLTGEVYVTTKIAQLGCHLGGKIISVIMMMTVIIGCWCLYVQLFYFLLHLNRRHRWASTHLTEMFFYCSD